MYALLIKPAAMRSGTNRKFVGDLINDEAVVLHSHTVDQIRAEVMVLQQIHQELTVVACGGDGTVNLLINAVVDLEVKFAIIPMGTGNDIARHIGIRSAKEGTATLATGKVMQVDVGQIEMANTTKLFLGVTSCGFDAQVNERANKLTGPSGTAKYLVSVFGELASLGSLSLALKSESETITGNFALVALGNTSSYGGGMKITPSADMTDGALTATIVQAVNRRTLVQVLPRVFTGKHVYHPKVAVAQFSALEISGDEFPIYADGERMGIGPAKFSVLPSHLQLVVP